jgi:hypothetical protein
MKKLFALVLVVALAAAGAAQAGPAAFGLKGGLTIAKLTGDVEDLDSKTGFVIGGFAAIPIGEAIAIQPEICYVQKGAKFTEMVGDFEPREFDVDVNFDYIDIPILFKYTVAGEGAQPYFLLGPSIGFNTKAEFSAEGETEDYKDYIKSTDFGLVFGLGVNIQQFLLEARYSLGLTDINDFPGDDDSIKNSVIAFQVGYAFR